MRHLGVPPKKKMGPRKMSSNMVVVVFAVPQTSLKKRPGVVGVAKLGEFSMVGNLKRGSSMRKVR